MSTDLVRQAAEVARDPDAGASEILERLLPLLEVAVRSGRDATLPVVRAICLAQPGMASLWNACAAAAADSRQPGTFDRALAEMRRAPTALRRVAIAAFEDLHLGVEVPRFLTVSFSGSVCGALVDVARSTGVEVVCAESRPRFEGRRTAALLAAAGLRVTIATDAAMASLLEGATAVVVGADAVKSSEWINKIGTHALAATAAAAGVPVLVFASRDKFVPPALEPELKLESGPSSDVWSDAPARVLAVNPVFETIPLTLATQLVTDRGLVPPAQAAAVAAPLQRNASLLMEMLRYGR